MRSGNRLCRTRVARALGEARRIPGFTCGNSGFAP